MHLGEILTADTANGPGIRLSVFVSGCTNHCPGCFQPQTWDFDYGREYTPEIEERILRELGESYYDGLTVLGGEPFEPENQRGLLGLIRRVKRELPGRTIWMYTGFTYERGHEYELLVKRTTLANPLQDSGKYRYELVRIVSDNKVE